MKRLLVAASATVVVMAIFAPPALAGGTTWDGNGAATCPNGSFWVLSPGANVGTATLTVNGQVVGQMVQQGPPGGNGAYQLAAGPTVLGATTASASWTGTSTAAFLKLSHCLGGTTTGGTTTGGDTTGGDTTGGDTTGGDTTGGDTTGGDTTGGDTTGGDTTGGQTTGGDTTTGGTTAGGTTTGGGTTGSGGVIGSTTGGTTGGSAGAETGGTLPFTGLPVWIPALLALALLASGGFLLRRRRDDIS